jgi:oxaloacetate decarboxylase
VARTGAVGITGIDDAVARARAYAAVGPDALFFTGVTDQAELEALAAATALPIILGGLPAALNDRTVLAAYRVRVSLQGHQPFAAAVQALHDTLKALRDGTLPADLSGVAPTALMNRVTRADEYETARKRFLGG